MHSFTAIIDIIGVNPFVFVPVDILEALFIAAGKNKGYIPIQGTLNGKPYQQTLVKYSDEWRLYINTSMLKNSPKLVGATVEITIDFDPTSRSIEPPLSFLDALAANPAAEAVFNGLPASRKLEIVRYLARLKSAETLEKNVVRAINFLHGKERFVGREKP